jgi:hypothetical protein
MKQPYAKNEQMRKVFESAARFQQLVPDAVLVGGTAVTAHIGHRYSIDHDHVLTDLEQRFKSIFEMLNAQDEWETAHVVEGKIILGSFDGIETGLRQLRRNRPLETERFELAGGETLLVPTFDEILRIKAFLITNRNQVRDYLDLAALAGRCGIEHAAGVLIHIDEYYEKEFSSSGSVATDLAMMLSAPDPKDQSSLANLKCYKGLEEKFSDWNVITDTCRQLAAEMIAQEK